MLLFSESMSPSSRLGATTVAWFALLTGAGCVGQITGGGVAADPGADAAPGGGGSPDAGVADEPDAAPPGTPATATLSQVGITTLPGASRNAGMLGSFLPEELPAGVATPPSLSNSVLSAAPGTPPKALFIGQEVPFDAGLVSGAGASGHFEIPAGGNSQVAIGLVGSLAEPLRN